MITIQSMYRILALENPYLHEARLKHWVVNNPDEMNLHELIQGRRSGKTTRIAINAILLALGGKKVLVPSGSNAQRNLIGTINECLDKLKQKQSNLARCLEWRDDYLVSNIQPPNLKTEPDDPELISYLCSHDLTTISTVKEVVQTFCSPENFVYTLKDKTEPASHSQ